MNIKYQRDLWFSLIHYCALIFGSEGHVALDRNPRPGYDTLLLRMIPGDLLNAFPHRQFHTLPGHLDSWAALPNSNLNACMPMQGCSFYHFYDGLWPGGELTTYRARGGLIVRNACVRVSGFRDLLTADGESIRMVVITMLYSIQTAVEGIKLQKMSQPFGNIELSK